MANRWSLLKHDIMGLLAVIHNLKPLKFYETDLLKSKIKALEQSLFGWIIKFDLFSSD